MADGTAKHFFMAFEMSIFQPVKNILKREFAIPYLSFILAAINYMV
jgi:hypothetical protein